MSKVGNDIVKAVKVLLAESILFARGGNLSARYEKDKIVVTASGKDYLHIKEDDLIIVDYDGNIVKGDKRPSSELPMHLAIYRARADVQAIIHTHAVWPYILSVCHQNLPPISDEFTILLGGEIKVSKYAFPGTRELAENVVEALGSNNAALIANHGCVTVGKSVEEALENMIILANFSKVYVLAKIFGKPYTIPEWAIEKEKEMYKQLRGNLKDHI
ncbi:MAG: class II aldolase/adducin family protein [Nitrososphaeria archaeon]